MYVIYNAVVSVDGKIAGAGGREIMSRADKYRIHELRGKVDAVVTDEETIELKNPELGVRTAGEDPLKVVVDDKGEMNLSSRVLKGGSVLVASSKSSSRKQRDELEAMENVEVLITGEYVVNLSILREALANRGVNKILIESHGTLGRRMLNEGNVDELYISIMPYLQGEGITLFNKEIEKEINLDLEGIRQYGSQVVLHYMIAGKG